MRSSIAPLVLGAAILASCQTNPGDGACTSYENSRLTGLRAGASINPPDPTTPKGQGILNEIAQLESECAPGPSPAP